MKIVKSANPSEDVVKFVCRCGCEYEAAKGEYYMKEDNIVLSSYPPTYPCFANCPECFHMNQGYLRTRIQNNKISIDGVGDPLG